MASAVEGASEAVHVFPAEAFDAVTLICEAAEVNVGTQAHSLLIEVFAFEPDDILESSEFVCCIYFVNAVGHRIIVPVVIHVSLGVAVFFVESCKTDVLLCGII